jgi:ABC-type spermidine/putrescine transport system permease subunit II
VRTAGLILVILGGLALAIQGFGEANRVDQRVSMPSVVSGIVVTVGLLILASASRREGSPNTGKKFTPS